jgi:hypothetical protein
MGDKVDRLTQALLADRERAKARKSNIMLNLKPERREDGIGFDPYGGGALVVVAPVGGRPGYLPTTPMRKGAVGFYVGCSACGGEFESKGWAYCAACMALPADERRAVKTDVHGRLCAAPGCENFISRAEHARRRFCSEACRQRAHRAALAAGRHAKPSEALG